MEIEVGKKYKTRNGMIAIIKGEFENCAYPYFGDIYNKDGKHERCASFMSSGKYIHYKQLNELDIISEYKND